MGVRSVSFSFIGLFFHRGMPSQYVLPQRPNGPMFRMGLN
jgi:hypothetical protein